MASTLHGECIEQTLPDDAMKVLATAVAAHANIILNSLPCCAMPLPSVSDRHEHLLGYGRY